MSTAVDDYTRSFLFTGGQVTTKESNDSNVKRNTWKERSVILEAQIQEFVLPRSGFCSPEELIFREILAVTETNTPILFFLSGHFTFLNLKKKNCNDDPSCKLFHNHKEVKSDSNLLKGGETHWTTVEVVVEISLEKDGSTLTECRKTLCCCCRSKILILKALCCPFWFVASIIANQNHKTPQKLLTGVCDHPEN